MSPLDPLFDGVAILVERFVKAVGVALAGVALGLGIAFGLSVARLDGMAMLMVLPAAGTAVAGIAGGRPPLIVLLAALGSAMTAVITGFTVGILSMF